MSSQYGELRPTNGWDQFGSWGHPNKFQRLSHLAVRRRYYSDVAHRRPPKLCTMFGRFLDWCTMHYVYISRAVAPRRNFGRCKVHFASKSCVLLYWQRYCTALKQGASAKLCGVVQGMELRNFRRRRHLYSAGRPSRWASTHIVVCECFFSDLFTVFSAICQPTFSKLSHMTLVYPSRRPSWFCCTISHTWRNRSRFAGRVALPVCRR